MDADEATKDNASKTIVKAIRAFKDKSKPSKADIFKTPSPKPTRLRSNTSPEAKVEIDADKQGTPNYVKGLVEEKEKDIAKNEGKEEEQITNYDALSKKYKKQVDLVLLKSDGSLRKGSETLKGDEFDILKKVFPNATASDFNATSKLSVVRKYINSIITK